VSVIPFFLSLFLVGDPINIAGKKNRAVLRIQGAVAGKTSAVEGEA
jgi:hypothetical protein